MSQQLSRSANDIGVRAAGSAWEIWPDNGSARDIAIGPDVYTQAQIWVVGTNPIAGGDEIYYWRLDTTDHWAGVAMGATNIAVGPRNEPWMVTSDHLIKHGSQL